MAMENIRNRPTDASETPDACKTRVTMMPKASLPTGSARRASLPTGAAARSWTAALFALLALPLAGCQTDSLATGSTYPNDYRQRHPIALAYAPTDLDLFLGNNGGRFDHRQAQDLQQFLADYRANGRGTILVLVPVGPGGRGASQGLESVRGALVSAGVPRGQIQIQTYSVPDKLLASPIRLSFTKMQAKVLSQCGDWRQDLAGGPHLDTWQNKPYPNLGCAYQTALANQVDDPVDFVRPRAEGRSDIGRRMKIVEDWRKGVDPSTTWKTEAADVAGAVGGSN